MNRVCINVWVNRFILDIHVYMYTDIYIYFIYYVYSYIYIIYIMYVYMSML